VLVVVRFEVMFAALLSSRPSVTPQVPAVVVIVIPGINSTRFVRNCTKVRPFTGEKIGPFKDRELLTAINTNCSYQCSECTDHKMWRMLLDS